MSGSGSGQNILFDRSTADACLDYLKNRTGMNLKLLTSTVGGRLAYNHHVWSSMSSKSTIEKFWKQTLAQIAWSRHLDDSINSLIEYLSVRRQNEWLGPVLEYLPEGHVFRTTVYFIVGYDNIVYDENVALDLNSRQFHVDSREAIYYLIHEMAHAGYFRYRRMPDLAGMRTVGDLLDVVKLLTHLEGMGVISPMKLRFEEGGLLDNDYKILLDEMERNKRIHDYFGILSRLESSRSQELHNEDFQVMDQMSGRPTRLWYITGCHMAQRIEEIHGVETLRQLVKMGPEEFFQTYRDLKHS